MAPQKQPLIQLATLKISKRKLSFIKLDYKSRWKKRRNKKDNKSFYNKKQFAKQA